MYLALSSCLCQFRYNFPVNLVQLFLDQTSRSLHTLCFEMARKYGYREFKVSETALSVCIALAGKQKLCIWDPALILIQCKFRPVFFAEVAKQRANFPPTCGAKWPDETEQCVPKNLYSLNIQSYQKVKVVLRYCLWVVQTRDAGEWVINK